MTNLSIPSSTYRLQFHRGFTFQHARELVPYLHSLGITHIYSSPITRANPGSVHGYDVCDHNELNPELGTREDFNVLVCELKAHGMGLVVDFVPNHMGIGEQMNRWWFDVLENGPSSPYARFFDIDWHPVKRELENRVLLPILGDHYGRVLQRGELQLRFAHGAFTLHYFDNTLPVAPKTTRPLLERASELLPSPIPELASIQWALNYLPASHETEPEKVIERAREKEIARERLARLCADHPEVRTAVETAVAEINLGGHENRYEALDRLIVAQRYRLSFWRVAGEEINYRRFFDVNSLAAIRVELPEVFDEIHRLLFELIAAGSVNGVRIDHIDGLANPKDYLDALQMRAGGKTRQPDGRSIYLLVEKILGDGEYLHADWRVHGTTGYEFALDAIRTLVDESAKDNLTETYTKFAGTILDPYELVYLSKRLVMQASLASEVNVLGHLLNEISESNRWYRDFTLNALTAAVREMIACFPVYRTYLIPGLPPTDSDVKVIRRAAAEARRRNPALERSVFAFLRDVLLPPDDNLYPVDEKLRREFVRRFQQCTGPITAKGVEDTAFYVYNRLVALNEVGGETGCFGMSVDDFHRTNKVRFEQFPHSMVTTSTHDTKRSEDVRARIVAISEIYEDWSRSVSRWHTVNRKHLRQLEYGTAPDPNEEYFIYQTLLGAWPLHPMSAEEHEVFVNRIKAYMVKSLHEAKMNSSWIEPNDVWDQAVQDFVGDILNPRSTNRFLEKFEPLATRIAELGAINSLSQLVWKLTVPGVPDFYQGTEGWDFSLVDPDNRRPVDYAARQSLSQGLNDGSQPAELLASWRDGRIKMFTTQTLLRFRRDNPDLFKHGDYQAAGLSGTFSECCVAFERQFENQRLLVITPRLSSRVGTPPVGACWQDTSVAPKSTGRTWRDILTGKEHADGDSLTLGEILADLPIAVLHAST